MREHYVRPPLVAREPGAQRLAVWRFRVGFALLLAALAVGVYFLYQALTGGGGEGSPGLNQGARPPAVAPPAG